MRAIRQRRGVAIGEGSAITMEIVRGCLERHLRNEEEDDDKDFLLWEGNYWDEPVHDCSQLSLGTVNVLVNKIGCVLDKYCGQGDKVILFLPQVIQLPLSLLAAAKVGVTAIPLDPGSCSKDRLAWVLKETKPSLVITVDAFWKGNRLMETYKELDAALDTSDTKVLVIRHTCPNPGMPPPDVHIPARRPCYQIEWSIHEGRDVEWSEEIRRIPNNAVAPIRPTTAPFVFLPTEKEKLKPIFEEQLVPKIERLAGKIRGITFSLQHPEKFRGLLGILAVWWKGQSLAQFEGVSDYPDPARTAHIVKKYEVESLILGEYPLDPSYLSLVETKSLKTVVGTEDSSHLISAFPTADFVLFPEF